MKNQPDKNPNNDELRQQLWELSYGLLETDDEAALRTRIKSDPAVARLYSEVRLQAELVGRAARVEDSALHISAGPDSKVNKAAARSQTKDGKSSGKNWQKTEARSSSGNWLAVAGTVALLLLVAFGLYQPQTVKTSVAQVDYYFTTITAPANTPEGVSQTVEIQTKSIDERGRPAQVAVRLLNERGEEIFRQSVKTNSNGRGEAQLPGELVRQGRRVEVIPADGEQGMVSTNLQVVPEESRMLMLMERPTVKPGDKVRFSMFDVKQFSKQTATPATSELMVETRRGADVVEPMWETDPQTGAINGEFSLPSDPNVQVEQLAMRRRAAGKQDHAERQLARDEIGGNEARKATEQVERKQLMLDRGAGLRNANGAMAGAQLQRGGSNQTYGAGPGEGGGGAKREAADGRTFGGAAKKGSPAADAVVQVAPAPGAPVPPPAPGAPAEAAAAPTPAPGALTDPSDAPAPAPTRAMLPKQLVDQQQQRDDNQDKKLQEKLAASRPGAAPGISGVAPDVEREHLRAEVPGGPKQQSAADNKAGEKDSGYRLARENQENRQAAPAAKAGADSVPQQPADAPLHTEAKAALKDLAELSVPAELLGKDLVVIARRDGKLLSRREFESFKESDQLLDLPPEVEGRVDIELYRADETQKPVFSQQIVRAAARSLHFEVEGLKDQYKPGEKVKLQVRIRDEQGHSVAAAAGVRVWNDVAAKATSAPLLLVDALARKEQVAGEVDQTRKLRAKIDALAAAPHRGPQPFSASQQPEAAKSFAANAAPANIKPGEVAAPPVVNSPAGPVGSAPPAAGPALEKEVSEQNAERQLTELVAIAEDESSPADQMVMADNRALVQQEYETAVATEQAATIARVQAIGRVLLWGGAGLMLFLGVLLISRLQIKPIVWLPAVGLAAITLAVGLAWFVPAQPVGWTLARHEVTGAMPMTEMPPAAQNAQTELPPLPAMMPVVPPSPEAPAPVPAEVLKRIAPSPAPSAEAGPINGPAEGGGGGAGFAGGGLARQPAPMPGKPGEQHNKSRNYDSIGGAADKPSAALAANVLQGKKLKTEEADRDSVAAGDDGLPPDSLFWRPLSAVDEGGVLTIEFTMPAMAADYRLLLDAIGNGRVGGEQQLLICRE